MGVLRQRGFALMGYVYAAVGVAVLALSGALWWQTERLAACRDEFSQFKGGVAALGMAAAKDAAEKDMWNKLTKDKADAENAKTHATDRDTIKRLRDANDAGRSAVPAAPAGSSRPDLACFDRAEYQRADGVATQRLLEGARGLADEGTASTVDLNTAKGWAQK